MRTRRLMLGLVLAALLAMAARPPSADIRILTHDASDRAPHQIKAAIDFGLVAVSVLVTWTGKRLT